MVAESRSDHTDGFHFCCRQHFFHDFRHAKLSRYLRDESLLTLHDIAD